MIQLTIGMPVFNDKDFIRKSLDSLLSQTYTGFELIISDDGSNDGSEDVCREYTLKDKRIKYIRQEKNLGISKNMQFLLSLCQTEYFMWAGDDDLYDPNFINYHIEALKKNPDAVSAFGGCILINEKDEKISTPVFINYSNPHKYARLRNYIKNSTDYFGYGMFRSAAIIGVKFPVWWWPNRKTPYNNIFPTLCYYLTKGNFAFVDKGVLFYKRVKTENKTNHLLVGENNAIKESFSFWMRKLNLVWFSNEMIRKAGGIWFSVRVFPHLFYFWFVVPSINQFWLAAGSFFRNRLSLKAKIH